MLAGGVLSRWRFSRGCRRCRSCAGLRRGLCGLEIAAKDGGRFRGAGGCTDGECKENLESLLKVEPLALEVGLGLVKLVEGGQNSPLLRRIATIRRQMATDAGFMVPPVRVTDNLQLKANEYVVLLKGAEVARYELAPELRAGDSCRLRWKRSRRLAGSAHARTGVRYPGVMDPCDSGGERACAGIHGGGWRERSGYAPGGASAEARV